MAARNRIPFPKSPAGRRWLEALLPAAIAGVLGVHRLGDKSFWLDEAFSISVVKLPTIDLAVYTWRNEQQAAPYHFLLQPWSALGESEAVVRLLSVVLGVLGVLATYAVGRRFGVGFGAALIVAVAPFFVEYEQEARGYSMFVLWSSLTTLAYLRLVSRPGRSRGLIYVALAGSMIYVHPMGAWVVVAHALATLVFGAREWRVRLLVVYVPIVLVWLPMLRFALINSSRVSWIPPTTTDAVVGHLIALAGGTSLAIVLLLLVCFGLRRDVTALWLIVPIVGMLAMSFVKPVWVDRYLIGVLPALAVVAARGLVTRPRSGLILAGVVALSLIGVNDWYVNGRKDDWRNATAWVEAAAQPGDGIIFSPNYYRLPFAYYGQAAEPIYPHLPWSDLYLPFMGLPIDPPPTIDAERIWLVHAAGTSLSPELEEVVDGYTTVERRIFGTTVPVIELLTRSRAGG